MPRAQSPALGGGDWSLVADVDIPGPQTEGVIYSQGSFLDGLSVFVQDGTLGLAFNVLGDTTIGRAATSLPTGRATVGVAFARGDDGTGRFALLAEGREIGSISIPDATRMSKMRGVDVGGDRHAPVTDAYRAPFEFTGTIHAVEVCLEPR